MTFRYVLEGLDEAHLLEIDRTTPIPNASVTRYRRRGDALELETFADDSAVRQGPAENTEEPQQAGRADG